MAIEIRWQENMKITFCNGLTQEDGYSNKDLSGVRLGSTPQSSHGSPLNISSILVMFTVNILYKKLKFHTSLGLQ